MKFKGPEDKQRRIIKRFLFFPRTIGNETRWLEHAIIEQKYHQYKNAGFWEDDKWIN
jgi:hypothetical protein